MTLQDFFIEGLPKPPAKPNGQTASVKYTRQLSMISEQIDGDKHRFGTSARKLTTSTVMHTTTNQLPRKIFINKIIFCRLKNYLETAASIGIDADIETRIDVIVKNPEIIVLEDQHKSNSDCLVLDVCIEYLKFYCQIVLF